MEDSLTSKDSLSVIVTDDGKIELDWDPNDPRWSWMNDLTNDQISDILTTAIEHSTEKGYDSKL
jgi:hypothetical protein